MHLLLTSQLERCATRQGVDVDQLVAQVDATYRSFDQDRARSDRMTRLMLEELDDFHREREAAHNALRHEHATLQAALGNMGHGVAMFSGQGQLIVCNRPYMTLFGIESAEPKTPRRELVEAIASRIAHEADAADLAEALVPGAGRRCLELDLVDGKRISCTFSPMPDGGWIEVYQDISEQRDAAERIAHLAMHDPLTDLPNRRIFNEVIGRECARAQRGATFAVLCLDLDNFKTVNDTLGHQIGDRLLLEVAARLRRTVRSSDGIARLGGDEFAVVQVDSPQPLAALRLAKRLIAELSQPYTIDGHVAIVGTSIGIAISPGDGTDASTLMRNADMALYKAKAEGRGTLRFFEAGMDAAIQQRRDMEVLLRRAVRQREFELHYQPIVDLATGRIASCEALLRWSCPEIGSVAPDRFIPLAEDIGLIAEIGDWVLRIACRTASGWPPDVGVAVNISAVQLRSSNLVESVRSALRTAKLDPGRLELEITETVLLQSTERTLKILHQLRDLGVRIAMDDFGTGYSSLSYLRKFPFDKLKIDRSFIRDLGAAPEARAIVRAMTELAGCLGMRTTAEGVETGDQRTMLEDLHCSQIQGYLISRPVGATQIASVLRGGQELRAAS